MDLEQSLRFCNHVLRDRTGDGLTDQEQEILRGAWQGESYGAIAERLYLTEGHLKDLGKQLWDRLSAALERKVGKKSLRSVLEGMESADLADQGVRGGPISPASSLAQRLRSWFLALHYEFEEYEIYGEAAFEWIVRISERRRMLRILVLGVDREAGAQDVQALQAAMDRQKTHEGWLVVERRISPAALELADSDPRLTCYTLDDLIDEAAEFDRYIHWLEQEVTSQRIDQYYVSIGGDKDDVDPVTHRQVGRSHYEDTREYIDLWMADPAKEHISILGEFGTGKTWFALRYAWERLQDYLQAKRKGIDRPRLPLVIQLRDYAKAFNLEHVLAGFFFHRHNIFLTNEVFDQLNRMGKLLLIFDGFDEMADRVDRDKMIRNFWELARVVVPGAKAILTCRTEHFPEAREGRRLLNAELKESTADLTLEAPQFEVLELAPFSDDQIRQVFSHRALAKTIERIMANAQLLDLARRPVMTDLILAAMPEIEADKPIDLSRVYLYAMRHKMEGDLRVGRSFVSLADKLYFLCELSWEMWSTEQMTIHYKGFPQRLQRWFKDLVKDPHELDLWHYDMMGRSILVRDDEGYFRPGHRSFLEFFVAYKIAAELGVLAEDFIDAARQLPEECLDPRQDPKTYRWSDYFAQASIVDQQGSRARLARLQGFDQEPFEVLRDRIGGSVWAKAVLDLILTMVDLQNEPGLKRLQHLILATHGMKRSQVRYLGGNIVTLILKRDRFGLQGLDLQNTIVRGADLTKGWFQRVNYTEADLTESWFAHTFDAANAVAFSPAGDLLASGHDNGEIWIWEILSRRALVICRGHRKGTLSLAFSPDGNTLASGSSDTTVKLWQPQSGKCLGTLEGHRHSVLSLAFSPDGDTLASGSSDATVKLWQPQSGECLNTLAGHGNRVLSVFFSPSGSTLASGSDDAAVKLWQIQSGECLGTLEGHRNGIKSVSFSPDGSTLASGSDDATVKLWQPQSGKCLATLEGHRNGIKSVSFSPDGSTLASGSDDATVKLWQIQSGECLTTLEGHRNGIKSVSFSPDGSTLASGSHDATVKLWQPQSGECLATLEGHHNKVWSLAHSSDGSTLASGSDDATVKLWQPLTGECLGLLEGHHGRVWSVALSPDGSRLASGSDDATVMLWQPHTGEHLSTLKGHHDTVWTVAFSPDGSCLASGSSDETIKLWQPHTAECLNTLEGHRNRVRSVTFSPNGNCLASGSDDATVMLWQPHIGEHLSTLKGHHDKVWAVAFSLDGSCLASGSSDETIKLWQPHTAECLDSLEGHRNWVRTVAFSPDGSYLASGSDDETVKLWSTSTGECFATLRGHSDWIRAVLFSPDGKYLISCSEDSTIKIWDPKTGECLRTIIDGPYSGMNISGTIGLTPAQRHTLKALGAIDGDRTHP